MRTAVAAERASGIVASLECQGGPGGERIAKPWGEEVVIRSDAGEVHKLLHIRAGQRLSLQYHRRKRETLILIEGAARLCVGPDAGQLRTEPLSPGLPVTIAPRTLHRLSAPHGPAVLLEIAMNAPAGEDDVVRLADDYGRAGDPARR